MLQIKNGCYSSYMHSYFNINQSYQAITYRTLPNINNLILMQKAGIKQVKIFSENDVNRLETNITQ